MTNRKAFHPPHRIGSALQMLALALVLVAAAAGNRASAQEQQSKAPVQSQVTMGTADDAEVTAYRAAKQETDVKKRAAMMMEFYQKYPNSRFLDRDDYELIKPLEDQYNAYYTARQEPDLEKRAEMLIDFLQKYPNTALVQNVDFEYLNMLKESSHGRDLKLVESLAGNWLKIHPDDTVRAYGFVAEAANNLQKFEKSAEYLQKIYQLEPSAKLAREIHASYQKTGNLEKEMEWAEKLFKMPEFGSDYMLRFSYVMKFSEKKNLPKAAEFAQLTLKSADSAGQQDPESEQQLRKVRRACHHVIASNFMAEKKYDEAIAEFKEAIKAEKYGQGYYQIGLCLDNQKAIEEACLYYAAAVLIDEEDAQKAKARLEVLYKSLHNNTLIGIDKVYTKAKDLI